MEIKRVIISRTDSIGDVVLTLPLAGIIKNHLPNCQILFIGRNYTLPILKDCKYVDSVINWDEIEKQSNSEKVLYLKSLSAHSIIHVFPKKEIAQLAKKANIPIRIGTSHRFYHLFNCNKLVNLGRKNSNLHEAQLNTKLLTPIGINERYKIDELSSFLKISPSAKLDSQHLSLLESNTFNLILHPRSKGSAREWGLQNYSQLIRLLPNDKFKIFITGTEEEGLLIRDELIKLNPSVTDLTGKLRLEELLSFINKSDGLIAASTGPLHIAAALNIHAIGIYPPIRPMHPGRWAPIGEKTKIFVKNKKCSLCKNNQKCICIMDIDPESIANYLIRISHIRNKEQK